MYRGFPWALVPLLRCSRDGEALTLDSPAPPGPYVNDGVLRCAKCASTYVISRGIASLLIEGTLNDESVHEMRERDNQYAAAPPSIDPFIRRWRQATEVEPTLAACTPYAGKVVAELGCGTGRFTMVLARHAAAMLAIDFSRECLVQLSQKLEGDEQIGLVRADIGALHLAPNSFECVLSTAHSNLPTREHRLASNRTASAALTSGGRYVFSMHFHAARDFLHAVPAAGHYAGTGIYRYHMRATEAKREGAPYFARIRVQPILMSLPGVRSLVVTRIAQRIPIVNSLASLLLGIAERPRRVPEVNYVSPLSIWVTKLLGRTPSLPDRRSTATRTD
jgi:SAM-dependent methyltransferase